VGYTKKTSKFLEFWQAIFEQVPEAYRNSTEIRLDAEESYGTAYMECSVFYLREETDEEEIYRENRAAASAAEMKSRKMDQYLKLQKELGL
jgi:uncharacterized protein (UPF0128 family)